MRFGLDAFTRRPSWNKPGRKSQSMSTIPANIQFAYVTIAILCLLMGCSSMMVSALNVKTLMSFRNENEYLNTFIQTHLPHKLFLNKYRFIQDDGASLSSFLSPIYRVWSAVSKHVVNIGPAVAMALLTTRLLVNDWRQNTK